MSKIIDLKKTDDVRDAIFQAVEHLAAGNLIIVPTETVYGIAASALNEKAVQRIYDLKGRKDGKPFALGIKSSDDALDYVPDMSPLQRRLTRRCWPGPVTFVFDLHQDSVVHRLPDLVRTPLTEAGTLGLRVPAHQITLEILRLCAGPLVLTSANLTGEAEATNGDQISEGIIEGVDLVLNDGPSQLGQSSSVVKVNDNQYEFLRPGVVTEDTLKAISSLLILVVCTGNTCRSPMGEALFRRRIAEKMGCTDAELEAKGVKIVSAGIAAMPGNLASPQSVEVMDSMGMDIEDHSSQPVSPHLVKFADLIVTMTEGHRYALVQNWPQAASRTFTMRHDQGDVSDPIGMPVDHYRKCAEQIDENVKLWVDEIVKKGMLEL